MMEVLNHWNEGVIWSGPRGIDEYLVALNSESTYVSSKIDYTQYVSEVHKYAPSILRAIYQPRLETPADSIHKFKKNSKFANLLKKQKDAELDFNKTMINILTNTDFTDQASVLSALKDCREELDKVCNSINDCIAYRGVEYAYRHKKLDSLVMNLKTQYTKEIAELKKKLDYLKLLDSVINVASTPDDNNAMDQMIQEVLKLQSTIQISPTSKELFEALEPLFKTIGIRNFVNNGKMPNHLKGTVFDLPAEMTEIYLDLMVELLQKNPQNNNLAECYEQIILKNRSISALNILACKEMIKLGKYDIVLKVLSALSSDFNQKIPPELLSDLFTLKLVCQVGLEDFKSAEQTLQEIPQAFLSQEHLQQIKLQVDVGLAKSNTARLRSEGWDETLVAAISEKLKVATDKINKVENFIKTNNITELMKLTKDDLSFRGKGTHESVMHTAVRMGNLEMVKIFYERGVSLYHFDNEGSLPIHYAALEGCVDVLDWLLKQDPGLVNIKNDYGWTPLHAAAISNAFPVMRCLIEHNADVSATDDNYRTAVDVLRQDEDYAACFASYNNTDIDSRTLLLGILPQLDSVDNADV